MFLHCASFLFNVQKYYVHFLIIKGEKKLYPEIGFNFLSFIWSEYLIYPGQTEFVYEPIIIMGASLPQNILPDFVYGEYSLRYF